MVAKIALAAAAILAVTPAGVTLLWPGQNESAALRSVETTGPILGFTQSRDRIQVRLVPAATNAERDARKQVVVSDKDGDRIAIPLKRGQTWASAELPGNLIDAKSIEISVE